jgi:hypothetical protein
LIPIVPETENFADRPNSLSKSKAKYFGGSESGLCAWAEKISAGKSVCYCAENDRVGIEAEEGEAILPRINPSARSGDEQAKNDDLRVGQFVAHDRHHRRQPFELVTGQEAEDERRLGGCSPSAKARNLAANSSEASK